MTLLAHYRSGWKEPYCSFVLLLEKRLGVGGGHSYNGFLLIFSGGVIELHAAPIATTVFSSLAPPRSAPPPPPPPTHY